MKPLRSLLPTPIFWITFFIALSYTSYAQVEKDTLLASQYYKTADSLLIDRKLDSSLVYFQKALPLYKKAEVWERVAKCHNKVFNVHWYNHSTSKELLESANLALEICNRYLKKNHPEEATAYDNLGRYYQDIYDFKTSISFLNKALLIRRKSLPRNHKDLAISYHNIGYLQQEHGMFEKSYENYLKALSIRINVYGENHPATSESYFKIGEIYGRQGKYNEAIRQYIKVLKIRIQVYGQNHVQTGAVYRSLGYSYMSNSEYVKSEINLKKGLVISIKNYGENDMYVAGLYYVLGMLYKRVGKYDLSEKNYQKALQIYISLLGKQTTHVANTSYSLAVLFENKGLPDTAINYYQKALEIYLSKKKDHPYIGNIYSGIGGVFFSKGAYKKARQFYKKGLDITLKTVKEKHYLTATAYSNIAWTYAYHEDYEIALEYNKKALHIRENVFGNSHPKIAALYNQRGDILEMEERYIKALSFYEKALDVYTNKFKEGHPSIAESLDKIGDLKQKNQLFEEAQDYYGRALKIRKNIYPENNKFIAESYNNIAQTYFDSGAYQNALENYSKAQKINIKKDNSSTDNLSINSYLSLDVLLTTLDGKAKSYSSLYQKSKDLDDLKKAIHAYRQTDTLINSIRQTYTNYQDKVDFSKQTKEIYQGAVTAQLLQKDQQSIEKAFYYAEKSKSNTLKELLNEANAKNFTGLPQNLVTLEKELRINKAFYQSKITEEYSEKEIDTSRVTHFENKLFGINRRQDSLTQVLEKNYPKYYLLKYKDDIATVQDIQQQLDDKTTVLEFFTGDSITYAFTISKNNIAVQELATPKLTEQVEEFRKTIADKNIADFKEQAHGLYNLLIAPVAKTFVGDNLIIIPDGSLWHLNFELLLTQHDKSNNPALLSYLLREYAVTYANSANLLFGGTKHQEQTEPLQECLAFSFSDSTQTGETRAMSLAALRDAGDDLPGTRKEIRAISNIIDGQYFYGSQAIEANFKKNAGQYNILHLALHGEVDNERPENSKLYFTKSKDTLEDNLLYSHELFALDIPAELTVLSACNTGTGKIAKGEGIMSLGTAFQYAGTKSLLLTSWEVSDQTTPELMKYFYTNLKDGMSKPKALQQAKLQYLTTADINRLDPFYWGAFYLVGDAAPIPFESNTLLYWIIGIVVLLSLGGLFWYRRRARGRVSEV
ncbi:CHAT domain-containing protein [Aquimarina sediminis]|uniref:CHAT domain-containing protein n=1 Tax=Aquimarina sediminis TaxID=2070536 RepID=UPI000CA05829|nr:CHAT domain-containing tetratricopeptide repeat protein [Aquimarina sediminis]